MLDIEVLVGVWPLVAAAGTYLVVQITRCWMWLFHLDLATDQRLASAPPLDERPQYGVR